MWESSLIDTRREAETPPLLSMISEKVTPTDICLQSFNSPVRNSAVPLG
jgi:hypothetical protein